MCGIAGDTRVIPVDVWLVVPTVSPPMPTILHASRPIVELQDFAESGEKIVNCTAHCTYSQTWYFLVVYSVYIYGRGLGVGGRDSTARAAVIYLGHL